MTLELEQVCERVAAGIGSEMGALLRSSETHPGSFDAQEMKRWSARVPSVRVTLLEIGGLVDGGGYTVMPLRLGAYLLTGEAPREQLGRDQVARKLLAPLFHAIRDNCWDDGNGGELAESVPEDLRARNLYGRELQRLGAALWAVTWRQNFELSPEIDPATLADLEKITADVTTDAGDAGPDTAQATFA